MEEELFENLLALLIKELLARCKEILETRGTSSYVDKARDAAAKTKDLGVLLQKYKREDLLPLAKVPSLTALDILFVESNFTNSLFIVFIMTFCRHWLLFLSLLISFRFTPSFVIHRQSRISLATTPVLTHVSCRSYS